MSASTRSGGSIITPSAAVTAGSIVRCRFGSRLLSLSLNQMNHQGASQWFHWQQIQIIRVLT
jgi:hypothetical protein